MTTTAKTPAPMAPFDYRPDGDAGPVFHLRGLSAGEMIDVQAAAIYQEETEMLKWTRLSVQMGLKKGLRGWDELLDADGQPVAFDPKDAGRNIEVLGYALSMMLFGKVIEATNLTKDQGKN